VLDEKRPRAAVETLNADLQSSSSGAINMPGYPPNGFLTYWTIVHSVMRWSTTTRLVE